MKVNCVFSLESPHRGDSNKYTKYTTFNIKKKVTLYYPKSAAMGFFSKGLENEFETAAVNESSVFEPLKFYCITDTFWSSLLRVSIVCRELQFRIRYMYHRKWGFDRVHFKQFHLISFITIIIILLLLFKLTRESSLLLKYKRVTTKGCLGMVKT